jgi:mercuric ion transport protein
MTDRDTDERTETWTLFGSIGAALGAAVCCLGPVVLVSLGVSGAWIGRLSALEPYRPLFMVVAAGFLAVGFYRTYGTARRDDDPESCEEDCEVPKASRINRATLWIATVVVAGLFASPYLLSVENTEASSTSQATAQLPSSDDENRTGSASEHESDLRRVELKVEAMTCGGCVQTVTTALENHKGVENADVTLEPPRATVEYDPRRTDPEQISKATDEVGYPSSVIE